MKIVSLMLTFYLLISSGGFLTGCVKTNRYVPAPTEETQAAMINEAAEYKFETETYTNGNIAINYPRLVNLSDSGVQNRINTIIKENALRDHDYLTGEAGNITYELTYEVTYKSSGLISIRFNGYSYVDGAAHPNNFLFTANIDVKKQKAVKLKDLIKIDAGFVDIFKSGIFSSPYADMTPEYKAALDENLNEYDTAGWIANLSNADTEGSGNNLAVYSYLTGDFLVVSVFIPHYMGDFIEIAIAYKDLAEYKTDHALWDDIK